MMSNPLAADISMSPSLNFTLSAVTPASAVNSEMVLQRMGAEPCSWPSLTNAESIVTPLAAVNSEIVLQRMGAAPCN